VYAFATAPICRLQSSLHRADQPRPGDLLPLSVGPRESADVLRRTHAAVVYIWNDGKLPIKAEDVLEPLKIDLDSGCEIIDARILKVSRAVTRFAKGDVSDTAKNELPISFGILERNDGAVLQIIYTGKPEARVSVSGVVMGAGQPRESIPEQARPPRKNWRTKFFALAVVLAAGIAFLTVSLFRYRMYTLERRPGKRSDALFVLGLVLAMTLPGCAIVAYEFWRSQPAVPRTIWTENQK
jgi:hypothetical protein